MFCRNCGKEVKEGAFVCLSCGFKPLDGSFFCQNCGAPTKLGQEVCLTCGFKLLKYQSTAEKNKIAAGLLAIFLGFLGIHKFYLGYNTQGVILLLITVLTCGFGGLITWIIGLIEGIIYITKTDEDFEKEYVQNKKFWF
jgi:TM2 domain-containing membrane protein YozV